MRFCTLAILLLACFLGCAPDPAKVAPPAASDDRAKDAGDVSSTSWVQVQYEGGWGSTRSTLFSAGCSRVDTQMAPVADGAHGGVKTFLFPCSRRDVVRIVKVLAVMDQGEALKPESVRVRIRWQNGGPEREIVLTEEECARPLWFGLLQEVHFVGHVGLAWGILHRTAAEVLAERKDFVAACEEYQRAFSPVFRWGQKRIETTQPALIWEPELQAHIAKSRCSEGDYEEGLQILRRLWTSLIVGNGITYSETGSVTSVRFAPGGALLTKGLPESPDPAAVWQAMRLQPYRVDGQAKEE